MPRRLAVAAGLLLGGVVTGVATIALHRAWWGLILASVVLAVVLAALPPRWWERVPFAAGFVVVLVHVVSGRPEGDYLISSDLPGYAVIGLGIVVVVVAIGTLRPARETRHVSSIEGAEP